MAGRTLACVVVVVAGIGGCGGAASSPGGGGGPSASGAGAAHSEKPNALEVLTAGSGRRHELRYRIQSLAPWWLQSNELVTMTLRSTARGPGTKRARRLRLLRIDPKGYGADGALRYEVEVVRITTRDEGEEGALPQDLALPAGVKCVLSFTPLGEWRETTWRVPPGVSEAQRRVVERNVPIWLWGFPRRAVGRGAKWDVKSERYSLDLRHVSYAMSHYGLADVSDTGAEIEFDEEASAPAETGENGVVIEETKTRLQGRVKADFDHWLSVATFTSTVFKRLQQSDPVEPGTTISVVTETTVREVAPPPGAAR